MGGGGYIGSHLTPLLLNSGRQVTVLGRSECPKFNLPSGVNYCCGDYGDQELIEKLLDEHNEVILLAYATVPNTSFDNPMADLLENLPPSIQLFKEVAKRKCQLILVSSGGTVYGEAINVPINEEHPTNPISPYGVTKLTLEKYAKLYTATHGLQVISVRIANAFGVGQYPFIGQGFISTALASAQNAQPIRIFGKSGTVRDYIYVSDIALAIYSVLEHGNWSETYNIGSGIGYSNMDVVEVMKPLLKNDGVSVCVENLPERIYDVKANILDSTKLQKDTGWRPKIEFEEGIFRTLSWLKKLEY